jgi:CubicO group peptidase (beta-lactamase class C family)
VRISQLKLHVLIVSLTLLATTAFSTTPSSSEVTELGFSTARIAAIDQYYKKEVETGQLAGLVLLIARHGKIVHFSALGYNDIENKTPMETDSIFRLYSMTKPVTSTALMMLYEEGRFQMSDPISKFIPEFANLKALRTPDGPLDDTVPLEREPTMHDVMRHTAGFSHGISLEPFDLQYTQANVFGLDVTLAEMMTKLSKIPLHSQPGKRFEYSVGPDVQARLVEVLSGLPFDVFLERRLFGPLRMKDSGFWVDAQKSQRLAKVYWPKNGKLVPLDERYGHPTGGILYDPRYVNSYTVNQKHKGGSYGLVSTAEDYWRFGQMMLNGGELDGARLLSPQTVRFMTQNHLGDIGLTQWSGGAKSGIGFGLGFAVETDPAVAGLMGSEGSYFWGGLAETEFWVDPKEDMVVVAMTQHFETPAATALYEQLRSFVYSALIN